MQIKLSGFFSRRLILLCKKVILLMTGLNDLNRNRCDLFDGNKMKRERLFWQIAICLYTFGAIFLVACSVPSNTIKTFSPDNYISTAEISPIQSDTPETVLATNEPPLLWFSPEISIQLEKKFEKDNKFLFTEDKNKATFWVDQIPVGSKSNNIVYSRLFVLSVPFKHYETEVTTQELLNLLADDDSEAQEKNLWINEQDLLFIRKLFPAINLDAIIISEDLPKQCDSIVCYRISAFEETTPDWRILAIDGNHPLRKHFDIDHYPLVYRLGISGNPDRTTASYLTEPLKQVSNFSPDQVTSLLLSGTTALVRNTALQMEENGINFPAKNLANLLRSADITHISNEVPFYNNCPPAKPLRKEMRFCSDPSYIGLFNFIGTDVVELTGNHLLDWGPQAFYETLDLYDANQLLYYGGGRNIEEASQPLLLTSKGNRFAFLGCNVAGPDNNWASVDRPGALRCNTEQFMKEIGKLKLQGYIPIVTIQHYEVEDFKPLTQVKSDFWAYAQAGAVIVSGSQAHFPQGFDIINQTFIHYGVGNLFFDQMDNWLRKATVDIHYFYEGRYVNTDVIGIINEYFGQPRLMTEKEADKFFEKMFQYSFYYRGEQ